MKAAQELLLKKAEGMKKALIAKEAALENRTPRAGNVTMKQAMKFVREVIDMNPTYFAEQELERQELEKEARDGNG